MNIILVVFDSLRKDCVGAYGAPPWGAVHTPHFDAFAREALVMQRAYPEVLPTLPARRALYTGRRVYPFEHGNVWFKGDNVRQAGWGPIEEDRPTLAEMLREAGYRTALIADLYHMFKPSKNFWRGFDQWEFLRGQERDPALSGPRLTEAELAAWLPEEIRRLRPTLVEYAQQALTNMRDRTKEEDYFAPRVFQAAARWLEENQDASQFFLTVESFDPHEPWLVPAHYRALYAPPDVPAQVFSIYAEVAGLEEAYLRGTQACYSGLVSLCDRWFGYFMEKLRVLGLLADTLIILTADHGHAIGDQNYMGKRGYPSGPEVFDLPLMIRFPGGQHAGRHSDLLVQFHDIAASILAVAGVESPEPIDGIPFLDAALSSNPGQRTHVTIGWGPAVTVVTDRWWFNAKIDGTGSLLYDLNTDQSFHRNVASEYPQVVADLFERAKEDAGGHWPAWLLDWARDLPDAPGGVAVGGR